MAETCKNVTEMEENSRLFRFLFWKWIELWQSNELYDHIWVAPSQNFDQKKSRDFDSEVHQSSFIGKRFQQNNKCYLVESWKHILVQHPSFKST